MTAVEVIGPDKHVARVTPDANGVVTTTGENLIARAGTGPLRDRLLYPSLAFSGFNWGPTPPDGQLIAQTPLTTPEPSSGALSGQARVYHAGRLRLMSIDLRNVPTAGAPAWYAVWLRPAHHPAALLGLIPLGQTRGGAVTMSGAYSIPAGIPITISVAAAHSRAHPTPGTAILTGTITPP